MATDAGGDAANIDASADAPVDAPADVVTETGPPCDPNKPFDAPIAISELNTTNDDGAARLSHDEKNVYFARGVVGNVDSNDLYGASRQKVTDPFGTPAKLAIDDALGDFEPSVATNGSGGETLFFSSTRSGGAGFGDLYIATRSSPQGAFATVTALTSLDTSGNEGWTYALPGATTIYFRRNDGTNGDNLARATSTSSTPFVIDTSGLLTAISPTTSNEDAPVVTLDELTIFFASDRTDGGAKGSYDIWKATRTSASSPFANPTNVAELNTSASEKPTWISDDGCRVYMQRVVGGNQDIFVATRPN